MVTESSDEALVIPAAAEETHTWVPMDDGMYSRAELRRQRGTYQSTIPAGIANWTPSLSSCLSDDIEDATRALVDFDSYAEEIRRATP